MSDDYKFLSEFLPAEIKEERYRVISDMVRFITQCVESQYGPPYQFAAAGTLRESVSAALFRYAERTPKMPKKWAAEWPATIPLVIEALRECMKYPSVSKICQAPFELKGLTEALRDELQAEEFVWQEPKEPSVKEAYAMAKANFVRIETAIVFTVALHKMVRPSPYSEFNLRGADEIRTELYNRRQQFMKLILLFGNMLGDEYGREATKMMMREMVYDPDANINFSTIQFLQPLGRIPGSYLSKYDEAFRKDIIRHYERM
jgi:hypothetical protein